MYIAEYGSENFKEEWLEFVNEDPVHPHIPTPIRVEGQRTVLVLIHEDIPQVIICVKLGDKLPQNMHYVLSNEPNMSNDVCHRYAIFYSIFKLKHSTLKGAGSIAIKMAKAYYKHNCIKRFYTLSPIPELTTVFKNVPSETAIIQYLLSGKGAVAKFHIGNGAEIHAIDFNADNSPQRITESWGIMVNYDYSDYQ